MNERFLKIMEHYNFSPSLFADEIGVIRSSISHIVSGRNNPGVDLLQKVLKRFPEVSTDWLLLGIGEMMSSGNPKFKNEVPAPAGAANNIATQPERRQMTLDDFTNEKPGIREIERSSEQQSEKNDKQSTHTFDTASLKVNSGQAGRIKRITVFFEDNSFQDFISE